MKALNEKEKRQIVRENRQIIGNIQWDFVVTLNTRIKNGTNRTHRVWEFERRLNQALFGKNWRINQKHILWIHNFEETKHSHSHSVCQLCDGVDRQHFETRARQIWAQVNRHDKKAQIYIDTLSKPGAVAQYITKDGVMDCTPV